MKYFTVYETVNKETEQSYRGKHITDNPYDGYLGSGKYLKRAIKKYGIESFSKFVLYVFDNVDDMNKKEAELVNDEYLRSGNTYNLKLGGEGGWDYLNDGSEKHIKRCVNGYQKGYGNIETLKKWGKIKYEKGLKYFWESEDQKIIEKRKEICGNAFRGKHHTRETIKKMSESHKKLNIYGKNNPNFGKCWIYNNSESIKINKDDLNTYIQKGWIKGRKMKFAVVA